MSPTSKKAAVKKELLSDQTLPVNKMEQEDNNNQNNTNNKSSSSSSSRQYGRVNRLVLDKNSLEYKARRERNNLAVKKSRNKSKLKTQQTMQRVVELKAENERLETKVKILSKELAFLKDLFLAHTSAHGEIDLNLKNVSHEEINNGPINSNVISSTAMINSKKLDDDE